MFAIYESITSALVTLLMYSFLLRGATRWYCSTSLIMSVSNNARARSRVYENWSLIQDLVGPCNQWPNNIQKLF